MRERPDLKSVSDDTLLRGLFEALKQTRHDEADLLAHIAEVDARKFTPVRRRPRRSRLTAPSTSSPSGWAEITHPFHPLRGRRFYILKRMCVSGVDTLTLRASSGEGFAIAREWTDQADPFPLTTPTILEAKHLLDLAALLESLAHEVAEGLDK